MIDDTFVEFNYDIGEVIPIDDFIQFAKEMILGYELIIQVIAEE